jgi:3-methyladenine DNA glycosylase Mpg
LARIGKSFFDRDVDIVARELIGTTFVVDGVGGMIVETESYDASPFFSAKSSLMGWSESRLFLPADTH